MNSISFFLFPFSLIVFTPPPPPERNDEETMSSSVLSPFLLARRSSSSSSSSSLSFMPGGRLYHLLCERTFSTHAPTMMKREEEKDAKKINEDDANVRAFFATIHRKHKEVDPEKWLEHFPTMSELASRMNGQLGKKLGMSVKERKRVMQYLSKYRVGLFSPRETKS